MNTPGTNHVRVGLSTLFVASCLFAATAATPASAQTTLRWKFQEGETLHYTVEEKNNTKTLTNGNKIKYSSDQVMEYSWKVKKVFADGSARVAQKRERVRMKVVAPFTNFEYDSAKEPAKTDKKDEQSNPQEEEAKANFRAMIGVEIDLTMNPLGEVTDVDLPESLLKKLRETARQSGAEGEFSEEKIKESFKHNVIVLPKKPVAEGAAWTGAEELPAPDGKLRHERTYTFKGAVKKNGVTLDLIDLATKITFVPDADASGKFKVRSAKLSGNFHFDNENGRLVESEQTNLVELEVEENNNKAEQTIQTTTLFTLTPVAGK